MKIQPLGDKVLVKLDIPEEKTKGGLFIPDVGKEEKSQGRIVAIGTENSNKLKTKDKVLFGTYSGDEMLINGVKHKMLKQSELLAVFEDD